MKTMMKILLGLVGVGVLFFGIIQLVPVRRTNPPVVTQVQWDSPQTQALFTRACADCHSNQTVWPGYAYVAPVSWLIAKDVNEGREHFNIDDLDSANGRHLQRLPEEIGEVVREGEMPMAIYLPLHPEANLSATERETLISGLRTTLANMLAGK